MINTNPSLPERDTVQTTQVLRNFESAYKEDLEILLQILVKITSRTPEQIVPYLEVMLESLVKQKERSFNELTTPEERKNAFWEWANSHERNTPLLSDYAVSRESMYDREHL